jgi:predicted TPR repeat methyltransferase
MANREYIDYLPEQKEEKVLDIGCGNGDFLLFLKSEGYLNIYGVDIDKRQIDLCREKGIRESEVITDLEKFLENKAASYAFIMMKQVMYYFGDKDIGRYLKAIRGSLKEGGTLVVEVFNGARLTGHFIKDKDYRIKRVFTEHSLRAILEDNGFGVIKLSGTTLPLNSLKRVLWAVLQHTWAITLKCIYFLERGPDRLNPKIFSKCLIAVAKK